jgi:outer membrane protein TolC
MRRIGRPTAHLSAAIACTVALACVRRADYVPPRPPVPLGRAPAQAPLPSGPLTAADAVRLALERNPDLHAAEARLAEARARLAEAEAAFWPRLSADVAFLAGNAPSAFLFTRIDARRLPPGVDFNDPGTFTNLEEGLRLRWNVWNGGRDLLGRWAADSAAAMSDLARRAATDAVVTTVVATYLDARAARELLVSDDAAVRTVEAQVGESRVKVEGGGALRSDLLSLEVRLAEAREERMRTEVARRLALAILRELLALPADAPLELADSGTTPVRCRRPLPRRSPRRTTSGPRRRSPGVPWSGHASSSPPRVAPTFPADVESRVYGDEAEAHRRPGDVNWTVAVALSADLFDGGARGAAIRRARAALDELTESDRKALLSVARDVETAYLRLEEARERHAVAAQAVGAAEETLDLVAAQYRGGAATVTRYLEAEAARTRARTGKIRAQLDVDRATLEAQRATGLLRGGGEG